MSKNNKILSLTRDTFESSSIHAIPNIIRNKFVSIKIVWLVCFVISFGGCAWFMINSINDYLENHVVTSFRINYVNELTFPVIGICNLNFFNKKLANDFVTKNVGDKPDMTTVFPWRFLSLDLYQGNNKFLDLDPNNILTKCLYSTQDCNKTNDFEIYYDYQYGACLRYNSGKNMNGENVDQKKVYASGSYYGLVMEFVIGDVDENNNMFSIDNGFNIFIQNRSVFESYSLEGIKISPGTSTRISLTKNSWRKEPKPYSDCIGDLTSIDSYPSKTYKQSFSPNKTYSYFECWKKCQGNFFISFCNCSIQENVKSHRACYSGNNFRQDAICTKSAFEIFPTNPIYLKECDCPIECSNTYYQYSVSSSQFPTRKYSSYLLENNLIKTQYPNITTHEHLKKNVARIEIFFDEMKETVIEESIKTGISDLISNLGGTLGLFLGLSFLSLIEFVEVFLQALIVLIRKNNQTEPSMKKQMFT